ncbi:hypothetical protein [Fodinibius salsisoli]|uniref:6-bladed beta-propeller protein n=1 Tax=Fodinibius salsisoli TaxID=2820877 RepID=A0ABT3PJU1_9BACT|nr:hypothetical protein [Fodinibius salsisoli]MCW9706167.1 hypothetical protein [Fodinibius salsisoli]
MVHAVVVINMYMVVHTIMDANRAGHVMMQAYLSVVLCAENRELIKLGKLYSRHYVSKVHIACYTHFCLRRVLLLLIIYLHPILYMRVNMILYRRQFYSDSLLLIVAFFIVFVSCNNESSDKSRYSDIEVSIIESYEKFDLRKNKLKLPVRIKYDGENDHLLAFDLAQQKVLEINNNGEVVVKYGGKGRGPGELQAVENFYITEDHLYIVDRSLYLINKYDRKGNYISSLDYGELILNEEYNNGKLPSPPALHDNYNEPFITLSGKVLLPSHTQGQSLYQLFDWHGNHLANIGEIPENFEPIIEDQEIQFALENRKIPARDLHRVFPINDQTNSNELFLIYSSISKIAKYDLSGKKIWEREISLTPEVDSLVIDLAHVIMKRSDHLLPVRNYVSGTNSPNGDLYLVTYTNHFAPVPNRPVWIHQFSPKGKLIQRYKIISDNDLSYYLDIDFNKNRIYTPLFNGTGIRAYNF